MTMPVANDALADLINEEWRMQNGECRMKDEEAWPWIAGTFAAVVLSAFLMEMATFREPGDSLTRIAFTIWIAAYLGLLPCFFAQLRWLPGETGQVSRSTQALALAIFVPK